MGGGAHLSHQHIHTYPVESTLRDDDVCPSLAGLNEFEVHGSHRAEIAIGPRVRHVCDTGEEHTLDGRAGT